jgi:hypothetical protein
MNPMISKTLLIDQEKEEVLKDAIREFAERTGYILTEEVEDSGHIFTIYNRKKDSGMFMSTLQIFVGSSFMPERIRIMCSIKPKENTLEVAVRGDVMMNEFNYVNDRPKRRDKLRCEDLFEFFTNKVIDV